LAIFATGKDPLFDLRQRQPAAGALIKTYIFGRVMKPIGLMRLALVLPLILGGALAVAPPYSRGSAQGAPSVSPDGSVNATQVKKPPSKKASPIEIPGKRKLQVKKTPSKKATPIEIPGKRKPRVKKPPSAEATPIEIPGKR
jgi:hypothetical protein